MTISRLSSIRRASAVLVFLCAPAAAQYPETAPKGGFHPSGTFAISALESVNTINGNVNLRIPITQFPAGRAGMTHGLDLVYNSQLYEIRPAVTFTPDEDLVQNLFKSEWGGWRYGFEYALDLEERVNLVLNCPDVVPAIHGTHICKLRLVSPDGALRTLHLRGHNDVSGDGFYQIGPDGQPSPCAEDNQVPPVSGTLTYFTTDGSYLKLEIEDLAGSGEAWTTRPWTLYLPDGTRFEGVSNRTDFIYDRNDNEIEIQRLTVGGNPVIKLSQNISGSITRDIEITFFVGPNRDEIKQNGFAGTPLTWKVYWTSIPVGITGPDADYHCHVDIQFCAPLATGHRVVDRIDLPNVTAALSYEFDYSDDDAMTPGWGELDKITLPTDTPTEEASVTYEYKYDGRAADKPLFAILDNPVTKKELRHDGVASPDTWTYSFTTSGPTPNSTITSPDGGVITNSFHPLGSTKGGLVHTIAQQGGDTIERIWAHNRPFEQTSPNDTGNPFVQIEVRSIRNGGALSKSAATAFDYDKNGNLIERIEYDWVSYVPHTPPYSGLPSGSVARRSTLSTLWNPTPASSSTAEDSDAYWHSSSPRVRNALRRQEIRDGGISGTVKATSEPKYAKWGIHLTQVAPRRCGLVDPQTPARCTQNAPWGARRRPERRLGHEATFRAYQRSRTRHGHRRLENMVLSASLSGGRQWPTTVSCSHLSQVDTPLTPITTPRSKRTSANAGAGIQRNKARRPYWEA